MTMDPIGVHPPARYPRTAAQWERVAAVLNHRLFYVFMVLVTVAGYLTSSFSKYGQKLFGIPLPHWGWKDAAPVVGQGRHIPAHGHGP
ncbi:MAG: hypothetical protein ACOZDY_00095 [Pseudomonadota bacterium]